MAVCGLRTLLLIVCVLELIDTIQRQVFDFLGYMWLPIIANFVNIILIIFGSFGAVQYITKYLFAYAIWSFMWFSWNVFLACYYLNLGTLNRESGLLSLGTGSISWWEGNGWGCLPVWAEVDGPGSWRPERVEGCFLPWYHVELGQAVLGAFLTAMAMPLAAIVALRSLKKQPPSSGKGTLPRRPVYTIELSTTEATVSENASKPMTPRRVKRRSGSRGKGSSVRRSRRSYRNAAYSSSTASLPRDPRPSRPTSAHSSYSNFHAARPVSLHAPERDSVSCQDLNEISPLAESVPIRTNSRNSVRTRDYNSPGYDVVGPYNDPRTDTVRGRPMYDSKCGYEMTNYDPLSRYPTYGNTGYGEAGYGDNWDAPPPPAPPYSPRATPQAPGPPAYQPPL